MNNKGKIRQKRARDAWHKAKNQAYKEIARAKHLNHQQRQKAIKRWQIENAYVYEPEY